MISSIKTLLFLGIFIGIPSQTLAEPRKTSKKEIEKYCNLSVQEKYKNYAKYCKLLQSKKVVPTISFVSIVNIEESNSNFFRQEKEKISNSTESKDVDLKKLSFIDLNTVVPNNYTTLSPYQPFNQPSRRENPRPIINTEPVRIAREWEGYSVLKDRTELIKLLSYGNDYKIDPNRVPWCAAFMNAVLKESGQEGTNSLTARSFLNYGTKVVQPEEGDIVIFKRGASQELGHVAFFVGYEYINNKKYIKALGGNQKKAVTVALYPTERLLGIRRI